MGCRTHLRLAWSMQTTCKGLGKPQSKSARLPAIGVHPPHAEKAMQSNVMFPDRLSEIEYKSGRLAAKQAAPFGAKRDDACLLQNSDLAFDRSRLSRRGWRLRHLAF